MIFSVVKPHGPISFYSFCVSSSLACRCVNRCHAWVSSTNAFSRAVDFGSMWNSSLVSFTFFLAPCGVGWEYPPVAIGILRFFSPIFLGGQWDYPTTLQWSNMAMDEQTPVDSVEFPRTPPFFEDFRLPWLITSQYSLPIPKAGDISPSRGQEGTVGSPWVSVFPCSLLNGEKKELPTTCALMCHDQMVKIWIFSPWALVWKPNLRSDEQPEVSSVGKIFWILRHYHYDPLCADSPQLCWFASILGFFDRFWPQVSSTAAPISWTNPLRKRESSDEPWGLQTLHSDEADGLVIMRVVDTGAIAKWNWNTWLCLRWYNPRSTLRESNVAMEKKSSFFLGK